MKNFVGNKKKKILLLAGLDPTGNAGLLKDSAVCKKLNAASIAMPSALTRQSDVKYFGTTVLTPSFFSHSRDFLLTQNIRAIKIGMLANVDTARAITRLVKTLKTHSPQLVVVWDPALTSTSGGVLLDAKGLDYALKNLTPQVDLIIPNAQEACTILKKKFSQGLSTKKLALALAEKLATNIYVKGGHSAKPNEDFLVVGEKSVRLSSQLWRQRYRGTGCALSTAIACFMLKKINFLWACKKAKSELEKLVIL